MKKLFLGVAFLNLLDGIITFIGINGSFMVEANPFMNALYSISPVLFLGLKITLSLLLLLLVFYDKIPRRKWVTLMAYVVSVMYLFVFCLHSIWIIQSLI
ncbi:DUF5658 family protein [Rossellomorea vietnamensis]|uniref:DUF5658 family protein n=1 Tax=Rossellomorea vietnamensis TaxID=218284 RepID=UPI001E5044C6|nr:DUF5658 family protein [Rossellomorea vietnamensis]MCC5802215.1 hypothetical protein [Rossellomorea vietnamensis]